MVWHCHSTLSVLTFLLGGSGTASCCKEGPRKGRVQMDSLLSLNTRPMVLLTTSTVYRFCNLLMTPSSRHSFLSTFQSQISNNQSNAAMKSLSAIPHPSFDLDTAKMASLVQEIPWWIFLLNPATYWTWQRIQLFTFLILLASKPSSRLKSQVNRLSLL